MSAAATGDAIAAARPRAAWSGLAWWHGPLALAALAWLLRLVLQAVSGASLFLDEAQYWDWSRALQWGYYSKPPSIALLIRTSTALFGHGESGVRALAIACYPAAALVLAALAADAARAAPALARRLATWVAALVLASPFASLLGLVATTDGPLLLCWTLAMAALWWAVVRQRRAAWLLFAAAAAAGLLSKYSFAALLPGAALFVWRHGRRRDAAGLGLALLAAGLALVPHLAWNQAEGWPTLRHTAGITLQTARHAQTLAAQAAALQQYLAVQALALGPLLLPGLAGAAIAMRRPRRNGGPVGGSVAAVPARSLSVLRALCLWCSAPLALAGAAQALRSGGQLNWVMPIDAGLLLLAAMLVAGGAGRWRRRIAALVAAQLALLSLLPLAPRLAEAAGHPLPAAWDLWVRMRGWPQALQALAPAVAAQPGVLVVSDQRTLLAQAGYHWRAALPARAAWSEGGTPVHHYALRCPWPGAVAAQAAGVAPRVLVLSEGAPSAALQHALGPFTEVAVARVPTAPGRVLDLRLSAPGAAVPHSPPPRGACP